MSLYFELLTSLEIDSPRLIGVQAGRRAAADVEPSPEVQRLLFTANEHYAQGRLDEAVQLLSEIIRIDPIIRVTWYTLATIYEEEGEKEKAIQCKIVASHLSGSKQAAGDWADLGTESRYAFSLPSDE